LVKEGYGEPGEGSCFEIQKRRRKGRVRPEVKWKRLCNWQTPDTYGLAKVRNKTRGSFRVDLEERRNVDGCKVPSYYRGREAFTQVGRGGLLEAGCWGQSLKGSGHDAREEPPVRNNQKAVGAFDNASWRKKKKDSGTIHKKLSQTGLRGRRSFRKMDVTMEEEEKGVGTNKKAI